MAKKQKKQELKKQLDMLEEVTEKVSAIAKVFNISFDELSVLDTAERVRSEYNLALVELKDLTAEFGLEWKYKLPAPVVKSVLRAVRILKQQKDEDLVQLSQLKQRCTELEEASAKERQRYNDLLGLRIRQDPRFQDLNDGGRPELVVRKFQDICNQERLDAADELEEGGVTTDMETLELLSQVMQKSWNVAQGIVDGKLEKLSEILDEVEVIGADKKKEYPRVGDSMRMEMMHELKGKDSTPFKSWICKEVTHHFKEQHPTFGREGSEVEAFTRACGAVSWMIVLASPVMTLDIPARCAFDPKLHILFPECRVVDQARITKCLWPALRFTTQEAPDVKAHVFTQAPDKGPSLGPSRSWKQRSRMRPTPRERQNSSYQSSTM